MSTNNPYQSPFGELRTPVYAPSMPPADGGLPVLTMVVAIIDLIFCVLRAFLVAFGILGYMVLKQQGQTELATSAIFEVLTGGAMVIFGLPANGLLLAKKGAGVAFGWLLILATLGSLGVGIFQGIAQMNRFQAGSPEMMGGIIGLVFVLGIRVALIVVYGYALVVFQKWHASRSS